MFSLVKESNSIVYSFFSVFVNSISGISIEIIIRMTITKKMRNKAEQPKNDFTIQPVLFLVLYCDTFLLANVNQGNWRKGN